MAVFSIQQTRKTHQTGEPRGPLPSGGKTSAKLHVSLRPCAPMARSPKGGSAPLDVDGEIGVLEGIGLAVEVVEGGTAHGGGGEVLQILGGLDDMDVQ